MNAKGREIPKPRHALDMRFHKRMHQAMNSLLSIKIVDENGNVIGRAVYADGNVVFQFKSSSSAGQLYYAGEYDPSQSYPDTTKGQQALVTFTPDGGSAGEYITLQQVPAGISPDIGYPYWHALANSPPGQFL